MLLNHCIGHLNELSMQQDEGINPEVKYIKDAAKLEEDFYLSSSDKLTFLMRELKSELHPDLITKCANPLLVSKLDISEVAKFDFPRIK